MRPRSTLEGRVTLIVSGGVAAAVVIPAAEFGEHFGVSVETAKTHVGSVITKRGVSDRCAAAAVARSWGYGTELP